MDLGKTLRELRMEKNILQKEVAAYLQVSMGTISNYENNVHAPDPETLCKLADLFQVSLDYMLGRCPDRNHPYR